MSGHTSVLLSSNLGTATSSVLLLCLGLLGGSLLTRMYAKIFYLQRRSTDRKIAVRQSAASTLGTISEKIAPILPQFPYAHKDIVFIGKGVDYLCFDGLSQGDVKQVVFLEVKTAKSTLNANEKRIKAAIQAGRVKWETLRIGTSIV